MPTNAGFLDEFVGLYAPTGAEVVVGRDDVVPSRGVDHRPLHREIGRGFIGSIVPQTKWALLSGLRLRFGRKAEIRAGT